MTVQETYCIHMDAYVVIGSCAMCEDRREHATRYGDSPHRVIARYPGVCEICDETIEPGQEIAAIEEGHWSHYECLDRETGDEGWWEQ